VAIQNQSKAHSKKKSIFILGFLQGFPDEEATLFSLWK
jgi:hypothetical protein